MNRRVASDLPSITPPVWIWIFGVVETEEIEQIALMVEIGDVLYPDVRGR